MEHARKVARIARQLATRGAPGSASLRKASVPHQVPKAKDLRRRDQKIDVSDLTEILEIDRDRRICTAESGVTFARLVAATLPYGLVPIVVPELSTITIGGAVAGGALESMSFRHGGFHDTCLAYEVITATGDVLTCTPDGPHAQIFHMMHQSFGTLGVLSKLTFRLIEAKPFVEIVYQRHRTVEDYQAAIAEMAARPDVDFLDGIIHAPDCWSLAVGRFVDHAPYRSRYDWMKIYYQSTRTRDEDYLETTDYLFRYDRGVTNVRPRSWLGRALFGKWMTSHRWLALAERVPFLLRDDRPTVTVDLFLPFSRVPDFMDWYRREIGFFPLWCVPYQPADTYPWLVDDFWHGSEGEMFLDLAIYGLRQPPGRNIHRELEEKLRELGGIKTLISHNYYDEDEFWQIYHRGRYQAVKAITDPDNVFRDLYGKTCRAAMGVADVSAPPAPSTAHGAPSLRPPIRARAG